MRFIEDLDWSYVAEQLGVPSIVLYREGLNMYKRACEGLLARQKKFGKFIGTHIVVANKSTKDIFVESGFVDADNVTIGGIPRMDNLCQLIEMHNRLQQKPSERIGGEKFRILVLYFAPGKYQKGFADSDGVWRPAGIPIKLFEETMASIVNVAVNNPDIEVLIKPKKGDVSIKYFSELCKRRNLEIQSLKNLRIDDSINLHEYMMTSNVVCGLQSTSVLEAAIAGKEVVVPYFEEFRNTDWSDRFGYRDHLSAFSIPKNAVELEDCLISGLSKQQSDAIMEYRRQLFSTWVSSPDGTATHTCAQIIRDVISKSSKC